MLKSLPRAILPITTSTNQLEHLTLGGCDTVDLATEFGTPLYIFDEKTLRHSCREFRAEFQGRYPASSIAYASKAYLGRALAALLAEEGMDLDVVSGGELSIAISVGFPPERIHFHGNNKSEEELAQALDYGVGRIVVDNFREIKLLSKVATALNTDQKVLLRLTPGVDPRTHVYTSTGITDSKFGFPMLDGQAESALQRTIDAPNLEPMGLHIHLGSPIFSVEPYRRGIKVAMEFASKMREEHGFQLLDFSPGGGFAVQYLEAQEAPAIAQYADAIVSSINESVEMYMLPAPHVIIEPGRSIAARAGVALYRVGASKEIPGVRRYVSVDGGMADNIRPALYKAEYAAVLANRANDTRRELVTIAGKYCESGDLLLRDAELPPLSPGDLVAVPSSGAYCLPMASNYNGALKPPIVMVNDGEATLVRRGESYEDLIRHDVYPPE